MQLSAIANATGSLAAARKGATVTQLPGGAILVTGGQDVNGDALASAAIYDPSTGQGNQIGVMTAPRYGHTATLLTDGRVLICGGQTTGGGYLASAEYFKLSFGAPAAGSFTAAIAGLSAARANHAAVLLHNGLLLIVGGANGGAAALTLAELYVPATAAEMAGIGGF